MGLLTSAFDAEKWDLRRQISYTLYDTNIRRITVRPTFAPAMSRTSYVVSSSSELEEHVKVGHIGQAGQAGTAGQAGAAGEAAQVNSTFGRLAWEPHVDP